MYHCWKDLLKNALNSILRVCIYKCKFINQRSFYLEFHRKHSAFEWLTAVCLHPNSIMTVAASPRRLGPLSCFLGNFSFRHPRVKENKPWPCLDSWLSGTALHPFSLQVFCVRRAIYCLSASPPHCPYLLLFPCLTQPEPQRPFVLEENYLILKSLFFYTKLVLSNDSSYDLWDLERGSSLTFKLWKLRRKYMY